MHRTLQTRSQTQKGKYDRVFHNKDLFTEILSYLSVRQLKYILSHFKHMVHYNFLAPTMHTLLFGQVQCGKTSKIMHYVQLRTPLQPKILILPNNLAMLNQYAQNFKARQISYKIISKKSVQTTMNEPTPEVILTLYNKFRLAALATYTKQRPAILSNFSLILDESDQYIRKIKSNSLYSKAKEVLHVTATPFNYCNVPLDRVVMLKPKPNYIGLNNIDMREQYVPPTLEDDAEVETTDIPMSKRHQAICQILATDFRAEENHFMLITCFNFIRDMTIEARTISRHYPEIPVVLLSSKSHILYNGIIRKKVSHKNIQKLFDTIEGPVIVFANRLADRGINYTNSLYNRFITHQITIVSRTATKFASSSITSFVQKCRVFGNRNPDQPAPILYVLTPKKDFCENLKTRVNYITQKYQQKMENGAPTLIPTLKGKITVQLLKDLCRQNYIKGFSKLKKQELIALLATHDITV